MAQIIPFPRKKPRILVVDDDYWTVDVLVEYTGNFLGYDAHGVYSAEQAIAHLKSCRDVDLVITDIQMLGMNGIELAKILTQNWGIKVIVMTGRRYGNAGKEAINAGASNFFYKPINLDNLKVIIEAELKR